MALAPRKSSSCARKVVAFCSSKRSSNRSSACRRAAVIVWCFLMIFLFWDFHRKGVVRDLVTTRLRQARNFHLFRTSSSNQSTRCIRESYDKSKRYVIVRNAFLADKEHRRNDVTLLTQCDTGKLRYVIELADRWQGPMHVSLYFVTFTLKDRVVEMINEIRLCHKNVRDHVTWHFAYPAFERIRILASSVQKPITANRPKRLVDVDVDGDVESFVQRNPNCSMDILKKISKFKGYSVSVDPDRRNKNGTYIAFFPMNVLANVAREESKTEFVFFIDADLVPNSGLRDDFVDFARRKNLFGRSTPKGAVDSKRISVRYLQWATPAPPQTFMDFTKPVCLYHHDNKPYEADVYVVPSFQYKGPDAKIPGTLKELKRCHSEERVTRYYGGALFHPYGPTGHAYWLNMERDKKLDCAYRVKYHMNYEPYHIARRSYPMYDERFAGHGNVKVSHVAEVASYGYSFKVLNNAFLAHRGWKRKREKEFAQKIQEYKTQEAIMDVKLDELEKAFNSSYLPNAEEDPTRLKVQKTQQNPSMENPEKPRMKATGEGAKKQGPRKKKGQKKPSRKGQKPRRSPTKQKQRERKKKVPPQKQRPFRRSKKL